MAQTLALNAVEGACPSSPVSSCVASATDTGENLMVSPALTGGTQYCFIGAADPAINNTEDFVLSVTTNCGALPVEIQMFVVEPGTSDGG